MALKEDNHAGAASGGGKAITDKQAEDAFRTIIKWIGEDTDRDGLERDARPHGARLP